MYCGHTVGVVVPAYNEADHVGEVIESLPSFVDTVYAVDDCSTDDTWDVLTEYAPDQAVGSGRPPLSDAEDADRTTVVGDDRSTTGADDHANGTVVADRRSTTGAADSPDRTGGSHPGDADRTAVTDGQGVDGPTVVPLRHEVNRGPGGALKTGYRRAERDGCDVVVTIDADGQMDPTQMDRLLDPLVEGRAEYAKGNRLADAECPEAMPGFRLFGNWLLTLLTKVASGYWGLRDPQNGYTAITGEALADIDVERLPDTWGYTNDLLARLNAAGLRVADVPMAAVYGDEESTIEFATYVRYTSTALAESFLRRIGRAGAGGRPHLVVMWTLAVVGVGAGVLTLATTAARAFVPFDAFGVDRAGRASLLVAGTVATLLALGVDARGKAEVIRE